jgi:hypothetical protein
MNFEDQFPGKLSRILFRNLGRFEENSIFGGETLAFFLGPRLIKTRGFNIHGIMEPVKGVLMGYASFCSVFAAAITFSARWAGTSS